jgi:hypothetical protein
MQGHGQFEAIDTFDKSCLADVDNTSIITVNPNFSISRQDGQFDPWKHTDIWPKSWMNPAEELARIRTLLKNNPTPNEKPFAEYELPIWERFQKRLQDHS